jgi:hypothetical protein
VTPERQREVRANRRREGKCSTCGRVPVEGRMRCHRCLAKAQALADQATPERRERSRQHKQQWTTARIRSGWCQRCGREPLAPGKTLGVRCLAAQQVRRRAQLEENQRAGVCNLCRQAPHVAGRTHCAQCLAAANTRERARYAADPEALRRWQRRWRQTHSGRASIRRENQKPERRASQRARYKRQAMNPQYRVKAADRSWFWRLCRLFRGTIPRDVLLLAREMLDAQRRLRA